MVRCLIIKSKYNRPNAAGFPSPCFLAKVGFSYKYFPIDSSYFCDYLQEVFAKEHRNQAVQQIRPCVTFSSTWASLPNMESHNPFSSS